MKYLRLFQVYGEGENPRRLYPSLKRASLTGNDFYINSGNQIRDFCHVDDVIKAIFLSLNSKKSNGEIINIGNGKPTKIKDVIKKISRIAKGGKPQFGKIKYRKDENMKVYPNIKKAFIKLKWKPQINLNEGIKIVIKTFGKNEC